MALSAADRHAGPGGPALVHRRLCDGQPLDALCQWAGASWRAAEGPGMKPGRRSRMLHRLLVPIAAAPLALTSLSGAV